MDYITMNNSVKICATNKSSGREYNEYNMRTNLYNRTEHTLRHYVCICEE